MDEPTVALVVADTLDEEVVTILESVHNGGRQRIVLVASHIDDLRGGLI